MPAQNNLAKWRSPLLLTVISLLVFEFLSGNLLFFFASFLTHTAMLIKIHWILGTVALLPYAIYQWRHYFSVREYSSQFHYKLGLLTFFSVLLVSASGVPLIFDLDHGKIFYTVVDLIHTVSSFIFLMLLSGHLVLVARITLRRVDGKTPVAAGALALIGRTTFWIPITISAIALMLILFFSLN